MKPPFQPIFTPQPANLETLFQQGCALHRNGQLEKAWKIYGQVLKIQPKHFGSLHMAGLLAGQANNCQLAVELIGKAIEINPKSAEALGNLGTALMELKQYQAALESYDKLLTIMPNHAETYSNRGNALKSLNQYQAALDSYDKAIQLKPDFAVAFNNRGTVLLELGQHEAAVDSYDRAIKLKPDFVSAYLNLGPALLKLRQYKVALSVFDRIEQLTPDNVDVYYNRGTTLMELRQYEEALDCFDKAINLKSDNVDAYCGRATALYAQKQYQKALINYEKSYLLKPDMPFLLGMLIRVKMLICDWHNLNGTLDEFEKKIHENKEVSSPFCALGVTDSAALQQKAAEVFAQHLYPANQTKNSFFEKTENSKIRIGYYSADYREHATTHLMAGLFDVHDRSKFELFAFSFGPDAQDAMQQRVVAAFDHFLDVRFKSDRDIAQLSRDLGIDIAVDLKGFTDACRTNIFAFRAAPIQVNYLGYPGTMGSEYIDYIVADRTLIPADSQQYYHEKIAYLPDSYQINDGNRQISDESFTREGEGLPENGFVFCCFNNNYKITPQTFDGWMRILQSVNGSVLWLLEDNPVAANNLRKEAELRGVSSQRIVFAKRLPLSEHLARHRLADLFLDTLPCNAHTTASDSLWAGLPVLTCMGEAFAGRVAASLLNAVGLPEMITNSSSEYEILAIELACNQNRLMEIKQKLNSNRLSTPLFNTKLFAQHIEAAYVEMYERYKAGLPPEHIYI